MSDESVWIERAQSAETRLKTLQSTVEPLKEHVRNICETLGAKIKSDGSAEIDFEAFVKRLGAEGALQVRAIIDEVYSISGAPGEKPRMRVKAAAHECGDLGCATNDSAP